MKLLVKGAAMDDHDSVLLKIIVGLLMLITTIIGWNVRGHKSDHEKLKDDHAMHKLNVSENYAKKVDLSATRMETNASLERIHQRIDSIGENMERKVDTIIGMLKK